ncbi:receptor expression-enhancing protein 5-like isoform X1 [Asterias rubens]|uniref:receptor expression-enhancing protein 5-like isoform X1 n=1 Tax=Asterias rubens TaxID=7604 RepID=UPI0014554267|nr:receptor expression-enhancing protein 5-like isoform X1 [Asterias rubens]
MANVENWRAKLDKALYEKNAVTDVLAKLEEKSGVKRTYFVIGLAALVAIWLVFGYAAAFISSFLGFLYPAYCSVKAIESVRTEDDTQWLTYWVVYSGFGMVEFFSDIFLSWFPFYYLAKMLFLVWCMAPISSNGSQFIYNRFIKPFVLKHQKKMDEALDNLGEMASSTLSEAQKMAQDKAAEAAAEQVRKGMTGGDGKME